MIAVALGLLAADSQAVAASDNLSQAPSIEITAMAQTVALEAAAMARVVTCLDNSEIYHACDSEFEAGCGRHGGTFECTDWYGDDCKEGTCTY